MENTGVYDDRLITNLNPANWVCSVEKTTELEKYTRNSAGSLLPYSFAHRVSTIIQHSARHIYSNKKAFDFPDDLEINEILNKMV